VNMIDVTNNGADLDDRYEYRRMSDDQLDHEHAAQKRLQSAIIEMTNALKLLNYASAVVSVDMSEWEAFLHDSCPNFFSWTEKINEARG
jgi:hypothetical protein